MASELYTELLATHHLKRTSSDISMVVAAAGADVKHAARQLLHLSFI